MSADFDKAIDRAVREMLDVEPAADLRGRVMDRIARRGAGRRPAWISKIGWVAVPLAAAAVLVLALVLPSRQTPQRPVTVAHVETTRPSVPATEKSAAGLEQRPSSPNPRTRPVARPQVPERQPLTAAAGADVDAAGANITVIEALAGPASIAVGRLAEPPAPALSSIEPAPMHVEALEIPALSQTPRERREE